MGHAPPGPRYSAPAWQARLKPDTVPSVGTSQGFGPTLESPGPALPDAGDGEVPEVHGGDYGEDVGGVVRLGRVSQRVHELEAPIGC